MKLSFYILDLVAIGFFFICWIGYAQYANIKGKSKCSLLGVMPSYRTKWMENMVVREHKIVDSNIVGNLMRMITFFASTTILIIAVIFAGLGAADKVSEFASNLPFVTVPSLAMQEIRMIILLLIFIYAFFKFTWSLRQNNFVLILIGSAREKREDQPQEDLIEKLSGLETLAAQSFNYGLRAYYFALPIMAWFIHPVLFMFATIVIVLVLNRREFHSETLNILLSNKNR